MSWFHDQPISVARSMALDADETAGAEVADGVKIERREVLQLSLGALAAFCLGWPQRALAEDEKPAAGTDGELAWDTLIKQAVPLAEKIVQEKKPNEEAYLLQLSALIIQLKKAPDAKFPAGRPMSSFDHYRKMPFVVAQFKLEPGAAIPYHDHRDYIGVLSPMAGDARVRSFEIVGADARPPAGKSFEIRETGDRLLTPGRTSHLSRTHDNIHDVRAGKAGARLLDFFTFYAKDGKSVFLNVSDKPKDPETRTFEATWK